MFKIKVNTWTDRQTDKQTDAQTFLGDELVGLISSCSNVKFLTPQVTNPKPTSFSQNYQMAGINPIETKCTLTLT